MKVVELFAHYTMRFNQVMQTGQIKYGWTAGQLERDRVIAAAEAAFQEWVSQFSLLERYLLFFHVFIIDLIINKHKPIWNYSLGVEEFLHVIVIQRRITRLFPRR